MQTLDPQDQNQHLLPEHTSVTSTTDKSKKRLTRGLIFAGVVLLIIAGFIHFSYKSSESPQPTHVSSYPSDAPELFDRMIDQSLMTFSMTEQRIVRDQNDEQITKKITVYDLSDMRNVRLFSIHEGFLEPNRPETAMHTELISVPEGVYMSYKQIGTIPESKLGHWFPVHENGQNDPEGIKLYYPGDPRDYANAYMGFYIPGAFDTETRGKIKNFIKTQELYQFFSEDVEKVTENGKTYYTYEFETDKEKFMAFNKLVADSLGKTLAPGVNSGIALLDGKSKLWINTESGRLERVDMWFVGGITQTIYYYDYNVSSSIKKPMPVAPAVHIRRSLESELQSLLRSSRRPPQQD